MRTSVCAIVLALLIAGCTQGGATQGASSGGPSEPASATISSPAVSASPGGSPSISSPAGPSGAAITPDIVVEVVTDDLRVRTAPGVIDSSTTLEPRLERGAKLFVAEGPVESTGFEWFHVLLFDGELTLPGKSVDEEVFYDGWVAAADTKGEPWLEPFKPACPTKPDSVEALLALNNSDDDMGATMLACFAGEPITIPARIFDCDTSPEFADAGACGAETGGGTLEPGWFDDSRQFIASPDGKLDQERMLDLNADPQGQYPDPMPYGQRVQVTGQYNHPGADACTLTWYSAVSHPTVDCRTTFAVTRIEPVEP
jgi:hypothetical protein